MKNLSEFYRKQPKTKYLFAVSVLLFVLAALMGLLFGGVRLDLTGEHAASHRTILLYVRLPRVLASLLAGAALAVSGAVMQGVLANRLASPSIVGVNAGAGLGVTVCTALGWLGGWQVALFSFFGALLAVVAVTVGSAKWNASRGTVILLGVALNSFLGAISTALITLNPEIGVMSNDFKVGDFSSVTYARLLPASLLILLSITVLLLLANELDILGLGEERALGLGLRTGAVRAAFLILTALLAGAAVSLGGLISFVGLLVPHAIRRLGGIASKHLLPLSALFGGGFVTLCDLLARTLFLPYEIPVGIIMAFLGAPFFVFLLIHGKGGARDA